MENLILQKLKWRYADFLFNLKLLQIKSVFTYYYALVVRKKIINIRIKKIKTPFFIRVNNGVDRRVLEYVFEKKYHLPPKEYLLQKKSIILDLGSNIGCTIVDFKKRFPNSKVYGYEMNLENFRIAHLNVKELEGVYIYNKAIWINNGIAKYNLANSSDAHSIGNDVENNANSVLVECLTIQKVLTDNFIEKVDFLKIDIEGAENKIFKESDLSWLNNVGSLNIEFHNINKTQLLDYLKILENFGFSAYVSPIHWLSILAYRK